MSEGNSSAGSPPPLDNDICDYEEGCTNVRDPLSSICMEHLLMERREMLLEEGLDPDRECEKCGAAVPLSTTTPQLCEECLEKAAAEEEAAEKKAAAEEEAAEKEAAAEEEAA